MAKRKLTTSIPPPAKRPRGSSSPQDDSDSDADFWKVREILDETKTKYLIAWEDNEVTGEKYPPNWEPKKHVTQAAIDDWNRKKPGKSKRKLSSGASRKGRAYRVSPTKETTPTRKRHGRQIVLTSSATQPEPETAVSEIEPTPTVQQIDSNLPQAEPSRSQGEFEILESQQPVSSPLFVANSPVTPQIAKHPVGVVQVDAPPSSFDEGAYEKISQIPQGTNSQFQETQPTTPAQDNNSDYTVSETSPAEVVQFSEPAAFETLPVSSNEYTPKVIQDSQSLQDIINAPALDESLPPFHNEHPETPKEATDNQVIEETAENPVQQRDETSNENHEETFPETNLSPLRLYRSIESPGNSGLPVEQLIEENTLDSNSSFPFETQIQGLLENEASQQVASVTSSEQRQTDTHITPTLKASSIPIATLLSTYAGNSLPTVPSQSLPTIGESAPQLALVSSPFTPPKPVMGDPETFERRVSSLGEKLKAAREKHRIEDGSPRLTERTGVSETPQHRSILSLAQEARRSPSTVPAAEEQNVTHEEPSISDRYETLLPQGSKEDDDEVIPGRQRNGSLINSSGMPSQQNDKLAKETVSTFQTIPITMPAHQRDQYYQTIVYETGLVERYLKGIPAQGVETEIEQFVQRLRDVVLHPDLVNQETMTQYEVEPFQQAQWDKQCSAKFRFLQKLLSQLREKDQSLHVALLASSERIVSMLETTLTGINVPWKRLSVDSSAEISSNVGLSVTLIHTDDEEATYDKTTPADLIIAVDHVGSRDFVSQRGLLCQKSNKDARLISLIVPNSVEHIDQSLSPALSADAKLRTLVKSILDLQKEAGKVVIDDSDASFQVGEVVEYIVEFLTANDDEAVWSVPVLSNLEDLDSQTQSESGQATDDQIISVQGQATNKRAFDSSDESHDDISNKKSRVDAVAVAPPVEMLTSTEIPTTVNMQDVEITHISDSTYKGQLSTQGLIDDSMELIRLEILKGTQERLRQFEQDLANLQYRFEEQRETIVRVTTERDEARTHAQQAITRYNEQSTSLSKIKNERNELKEQLKEANAKLVSHEIPERAEFEKLRLEIVDAKAAKEKAEAGQKSLNGDLEYLRQMYQTSSNSAKENADRMNDLQAELDAAQAKSTREVVKLRQMSYAEQEKNFKDKIQFLQALVQTRDTALRSREEEIAKLKESNRGRIGTRGNSLPRTPRLGSPMKLDPGSARGRMSRQTSPAIGEIRGRGMHPLRKG